MAFADTVKFTAGSSGTSDFSDGTALTGFRSLSTGAVSGQTYSYRAFSADLSQWENGQGVYTSGSPGTLARTTIYESSTGSKVSFSSAPVVILTPLKADLDGLLPSTTSAQGIVELATVAEALAGTDAVRAVTPNGLYYPTGHLSGLGLTNSGADSIVIAAGTARDSTDTANIALASSLTKSVATAWAVGTGNGGLDTGSVANTTYYLYLIKRVDTNVVDAVFSASSSAPTLPTNYTLYVKIGKFIRAGATNQAPRSYAQDRLGPTDWVSYTPTFTGLGTVSGVSAWSRRVGDTLEGRVKYTSGTTTGVEARMSLGFNGTDGNVTSDSTKIPSLMLSGHVAIGRAVAGDFVTLVESGVTYITFGVQTGTTAALAKIVGTTLAGNSETQSFTFSVPISGW